MICELVETFLTLTVGIPRPKIVSSVNADRNEIKPHESSSPINPPLDQRELETGELID
jgi:hypothetical protein